MAQQNSNDQEQHYKSLIDLFKYSVTFAGILFTVIALWVSYVTYKDGQEMRADRKEARQEIRDNLKEMKDEIREERLRIEQKAAQSRLDLADRERELLAKQGELENSVGRLVTSTGREIANTKGEALRQIAGVKNEATTIARSEAKNSISEVFREKNLEPFIEAVAKDKLGPKIQTIVDTQLKGLSTNLEGQVNDAQLLSRVVSGIWDLDALYPVLILDSLSRYSNNPGLRDAAKERQEWNTNYVNQEWDKNNGNDKYYNLTGDSLVHLYLKQYAPKFATKSLPDEPAIINIIYQTMKNPEGSLMGSAEGFALFNRLTGEKIYFPNYDGLEKAYINYTVKRYSLKLMHGVLPKPKDKK